jgi:hypothetical protein
MSTEIRLEITGYRLSHEKAIRDALDLLAPGITEGWLTYTLHGGGTASATIVVASDNANPRALGASLAAAAVVADPGAKAFVGAIETAAERRARSA